MKRERDDIDKICKYDLSAVGSWGYIGSI